jgi:hypothetical protein
MSKNRLKTIGLTTIALVMSLSSVQAVEALLVHPANGSSAAVFALDNVQCVTFVGNNLSVKPFGSEAVVYALDDIAKVTLGDVTITDVSNPPAPNNVDVVVYLTSSGEIVIESPVTIQSLALLNIDGKILRTVPASSLQTTVNVSALPTSVYLLQIKTQQGIVTKKIIKK